MPGLGGFEWVSPSSKKVTEEESRRLRRLLKEFELAIQSPVGTSSLSGKHFNQLLDVQSWLAWHWLNEMSGNTDTYPGSAFLQLGKNGRIAAGPLWDLDHSLGCCITPPRSPRGWVGGWDPVRQTGDVGPWWAHLLAHQEFRREHRPYWREKRKSVLRWEDLEQLIDQVAAPLMRMGEDGESAAERNFRRWPGVAPRGGSLRGEIRLLKDWLKTRLAWIDGQVEQAR